MILANRVPLKVWEAVIISLPRIEREKMHVVCSTDGIKINEQNKSIDIGPLYLQIEFEAICRITPTESYVGFEPGGVSNVAMMVLSKCKTQKCILP